MLSKKWKIYLIHHSHTDVGYTQTQETIEFYHVDYIKQAIQISEQMKKTGRKFVWTCEAFWAVECFYNSVTDDWKERFKEAVRGGFIEITGNYLNLNELADFNVVSKYVKKAVDFGKDLNVNINTAMTADINGYGWGYADALYENGIRNLYSAVHSHHGMYPLFRKYLPFYWESPKGNKLLVYNAEHYHFGNELGMVATGNLSYICKDFLSPPFSAEDRLEYGKMRIYNLLRGLEKQGYELNFIPITVHGLPTDNASPNREITDFVEWWNSNFSGEVTIEITTLGSFFENLKNSNIKIDTYRGDWPDWWAFGIGSNPFVNKLYKKSCRLLETVDLLENNKTLSNQIFIDECNKNMIMYSEHTFAHSASMGSPWDSLVNELDQKNCAYAINAHEYAVRNYNFVLQKLGQTALKPNRELKFKIINPFDRQMTDTVELYLNFWENTEGKVLVTDNLENEYITQKEPQPRGNSINFIISLNPNEERILHIQKAPPEDYGMQISNDSKCIHLIEDIYVYDDNKKIKKYGQTFENEHIIIKYDRKLGIFSWFDKKNNIELMPPESEYGAFMPIYEVSKSDDIPRAKSRSRSSMGRNMRASNHKVFYPEIVAVNIMQTGEIFTIITFDMSLEGTNYCNLIFKFYNSIPRADVRLIVNKESVWDAESLFTALPFVSNGTKMDLYCEKTNASFRVKKEQLPGTNMDYYAVQTGIGLLSDDYGIAINMPDTTLIYTGKLEYENAKKLFHPNYTIPNDYQLFSWNMNNIWETNFKATQGGFIEFNYNMYFGKGFNRYSIIQKNHEMNIGTVNFRID